MKAIGLAMWGVGVRVWGVKINVGVAGGRNEGVECRDVLDGGECGRFRGGAAWLVRRVRGRRQRDYRRRRASKR